MSIDISTINTSDENIDEMVYKALFCNPDDSWLKADIQDWLTFNGIKWSASDTKSQLLERK